MRKLIIIGAGGHGRVVADIASLNGYQDIGFLADDDNGSVIGKVSDFIKYIDTSDFFVAIGNSAVRQRIQKELENNNAKIVSLFHPSAIIANNVKIGKGTVIMAGAIINPNTVIGEGVIVNTNSSVDHDCIIDDFTHISVGAKICGTVNIGKSTWIGAGATVINNKNVCANCMVGAGATVVKDIAFSGTYIGTPARKKLEQVK